MWWFGYSYTFSFKTFSLLLASLYKVLSKSLPAPLTWETFLACFIDLDNLWEVFGCFIIADLMSTMFGFSIVFACWAIIFDFFYHFCVFFSSIEIDSLVSVGTVIFQLIWLQMIGNFFSDVLLNNKCFLL